MSPEAAKSFTTDSPVISCTCSAQHSTCTHTGALAAVTYHASRYPGAANSIGPVLPHLYVAPIVACTNAIPRTGPQCSTFQERCGGLGLTAFGRRSSTGRPPPTQHKPLHTVRRPWVRCSASSVIADNESAPDTHASIYLVFNIP